MLSENYEISILFEELFATLKDFCELIIKIKN